MKIFCALLLFCISLKSFGQKDSSKNIFNKITKGISEKIYDATDVKQAKVAGYYTDSKLNQLLLQGNEKAVFDYIETLSWEQKVIIQEASTNTVHDFFLEQPKDQYFSENDKDGDGYIAASAGGDDCDDLNKRINPGMPEICQGIYIGQIGQFKIVWNNALCDEDCDPGTVGTTTNQGLYTEDADLDKDGLLDCNCANYSPGDPYSLNNYYKRPESIKWLPFTVERQEKYFLIRGTDCDDKNPSLEKNAQKCIGENKVAICDKGVWQIKDCKKCITQNNGTGVVIEW